MTKGEKTRQFIIEQAAPIFMTKGLAGTAVDEIRDATGLSKGGIYKYFDSKEELAQAVVKYNLDAFIERTIEAVKEEKTAKDRLFGMLDFLSDPLNPPVAGGCPMMNFGMEADDTNSIVRDMVCKTIVDVQKFIRETVEEGIKAKEFQPAWDARVFATKTYAMFEGGILISRVSGNNDQMNILINLIKGEITENCI
jgi:TetR/AcrR family transcriptional repressor of nem operon